MDDLVRIRKPTNALGSIRRTEEASRRRWADGAPPLVQEIDDGDTTGTDEPVNSAPLHRGDEEHRDPPAKWPPPADVITTGTQQRCALCRRAIARYNCPQCNVPYCSLQCFKAPQHAACAQPFADKTLRQELGAATSRRSPANYDGDDDADVLGRDTNDSAAHASEEERRQMMDVLRRLQTLGDEAGQDDAADEEDGDSDAGSSAGRDAEMRNANFDIDNATTDELLRMLSPQERARFEAAIHDQSKGQERAHALLDKLASQSSTHRNITRHHEGSDKADEAESTDTLPWWRRETAEERTVAPNNSASGFLSQVEAMKNALPNKTAPLQWNIVTVLLAYIYAVRHLGDAVLSRSSESPAQSTSVPLAEDRPPSKPDDEFADMPPLEPAGTPIPPLQDEKSSHSKGDGAYRRSLTPANSSHTSPRPNAPDVTPARHILERIIPFLFADGRRKPTVGVAANRSMMTAQVVLGSPQEATLWIVSHLGQDCGPVPAKTMHFLYEDLLCIVREPIVATQDENGFVGATRIERAFADLSSVLPKAAQRKLVFYAAVWMRAGVETRQQVLAQIEAEVQRLAVEMERSEDEERWRAAHAALSQQNGLVLPQ